ncbi:MAG: hypothetical protein LAP40_15015 [Acidobacteriia bacterium]|nr:hypothetical protein [Terriglobia bacterium]
MAAVEAIEELAGVTLGPSTPGLIGYPRPDTLAAQAWWKSHKDTWPQCDDCHPK